MNSDDKRLKNLTPFKPGQSGNPAGRPPGAKNLTTIMDEVIGPERWAMIMDKMAQQAAAGDVASAKLIIERKDGQARQHIQVSEVPAVMIIDATYEPDTSRNPGDQNLQGESESPGEDHGEQGGHPVQ